MALVWSMYRGGYRMSTGVYGGSMNHLRSMLQVMQQETWTIYRNI